VNGSRTSQSTGSRGLKYPGTTDLATWNALRDAGNTTYTVGIPPAWSALFLDRGAAELAAEDFGGSYCEWNSCIGHMVAVHEREAEAW
jgi:hypothetical protein